MNRIALRVLGVALGVLVAAPLQGETLRQVLEKYETLEIADIVWGNESHEERRVGMLDPPLFTPNPEFVEVIVFVHYTGGAWWSSEPFTRAWRESLPERVAIRRMPGGTLGNKENPYRGHWPVHQRAYFAGEMLGRGEAAHETLMDMNLGSLRLAGSTAAVPDIARAMGVKREELLRWYRHPEVTARALMATGIERDAVWAMEARYPDWRLVNGRRESIHPRLVINGKYVLSGSWVGEPGETYRIANRLIRLELKAGRTHEGPTSDVEFTEWMAPRSGEICKRAWLGRKPKWFGVYNHARREIWGLGREGEVRTVYRLVGNDVESYFEHFDEKGNSVRVHPWRIGRQYVSFEGEHGPQRYGAFLLTDYLSAPDTHWVDLPFKGWDAAMAFSSDGKVEARNYKGSMFGSWWLEAGDFIVSFGELGMQSWPWQAVAERVGFDVPQRSLMPWLFEDGYDSGEEAMNRPVAANPLSDGGIDSRGR